MKENILAEREFTSRNIETVEQLFKHYPGPFRYKNGTDGVDETFDIFCDTTSDCLTSVHFWDERDRAEMIVRSIIETLNRNR